MAEIERKWRLSAPPPEELLTVSVSVAQAYLFTAGGELRVRSKGGKFFVTVKGDGGLSREEWEAEIPEWVFSTIWANTIGKKITKERFSIRMGNHTLEVDLFTGDLTGLILLECEFPDEASAEAFTLPDWAASAVEVTTNKRYKNKNLAMQGMPA